MPSGTGRSATLCATDLFTMRSIVSAPDGALIPEMDMCNENDPGVLIAPAKTGAEDSRNDQGQWQKGHSGNPAGRPRGSRHRVSSAIDELFEGRAQELAEKAVQSALGGDGAMLRSLLDRLAPPRCERPVSIQIPRLTCAADAAAAMAAIAQSLADGELVPSEAQALARLVETWIEVHRAHDLEERLAAIETALERDRHAR